MQVIFIIGNEGVPGQAQLRGRVKLNRSVEPGALASGYLNLVGKVMIHVDVSEQRHVVCDSRLAHACGDGPDTERATDVGGRAIVTIVETARSGAGTHPQVVRTLVFIVVRQHGGYAEPAGVALPGPIQRARRRLVPAELVNVSPRRTAGLKPDLLLERAQSVDIHGSPDAGSVQVGLRTFIYIRARYELRGQQLKVELASLAVRGHDAAIHRDRVELRSEATNRYTIADATRAVNRDARQSL